jgi:hypothetical protein
VAEALILEQKRWSLDQGGQEVFGVRWGERYEELERWKMRRGKLTRGGEKSWRSARRRLK